MKNIKKSSFSRGISIAKLGLKTGARAAGNYIKGGDQSEYISSQMKTLAEELGELKGTFMKVGQSLSMYGESFLPPEANAFLKSLQYQSPPLDWEAIEAVIEKELGLSVFAEYDIEPKALASASMGQVHKAVHKQSGKVYAMKVQYPGVAEAIESDVKNIKRVFSISKVLPAHLKLDDIFDEIKTMLYQECDYKLEKEWTERIYELFKVDGRFVTPKVYPPLCTKKVLTTEFIDGETLDSKAVQELSQKDKDFLGFAFLDHYLDELFKFQAVQTDPHLGNYRVQIFEEAPPKLVLFDFGAMRIVPDDFAKNFKGILKASALEKNTEKIILYGIELKYLLESDAKKLKQEYVDICNLITEPFSGDTSLEFGLPDGGYKWKNSDLPKRVAVAGSQIAKNFKLRIPPKESVFLNRKLGGAFIFLSVLGFQANSRHWLEEKLASL